MPERLPMKYVTRRTAKNIDDLAINMAARNPQLTDIKFSLLKEPKIRAGKQNVPTNVPIPLDSLADNTLNLRN